MISPAKAIGSGLTSQVISSTDENAHTAAIVPSRDVPRIEHLVVIWEPQRVRVSRLERQHVLHLLLEPNEAQRVEPPHLVALTHDRDQLAEELALAEHIISPRESMTHAN